MSSLSPSVKWAELRISLSLELSKRERNQGWERWAADKTVECSNEKGTYSKEGGDLVRGRAWALGSESPEQFHSTIITIAPPVASPTQYPLIYQETPVKSVIFTSVWDRYSLLNG